MGGQCLGLAEARQISDEPKEQIGTIGKQCG